MNIHEISDLTGQLFNEAEELDNLFFLMEKQGEEDPDYDEEILYEQFYQVEYLLKKIKKAMK